MRNRNHSRYFRENLIKVISHTGVRGQKEPKESPECPRDDRRKQLPFTEMEDIGKEEILPTRELGRQALPS